MLKRIFSILLCVSIFVLSLPAAYAAGSDRLEEALGLFDLLDIVPDVENKDMASSVTRAEFTVMLAKMIKFDEDTYSGVRYFNDLAMDHWAQAAINTFAEMGIISQPEDRLFRPEDAISRNEAVKMLTCLMGYQPYAAVNGGYPYGYLMAANEVKMLGGVGNGEVFTLQDALILSKNALCAEVYEVTSIWNSIPVYESSEDKTLLSIYWDIYEGEGILQAAYGLSVDSKYNADFGEVIIDGVKYDLAEDAEGFVGQSVKFFYYQQDEEDTGEILWINAPAGENDVVSFTSDEFISNSEGRVTWYNAETGKEVTESLSKDVMVVKNGTRVTTDVSLAFSMDNGEYRLVDTDGDGVYDFVALYEYDVVMVNSIDTMQEVIYAEDMAGESVIIQQKNGQELQIRTAASSAASFEEITIDSVLNVYDSETLLSIYVNTSSVSGTLEEISDGTGAALTIGGTAYPVYNEMLTAKKAMLSIGGSYSYKTDRYGKIAFAEAGSGAAHQFGYLWKAKTNLGLAGNASVMLFGQDGVMRELETKDEVRLDGEEIDAAALVDALQVANGGRLHQLVIYTTNSDGILTEIDTATRGAKESEYSLTCIFNDTTVAYANNYGKFDRAGIFSGNNLRFVLPNPALFTENQVTEDDFIVATSGYAANIGAYYPEVRLYVTDPDAIAGEVAAIYMDGTPLDDWPMLVDRVTQSVNKNGDQMKTLYVNGGDTTKFYIAPEYVATWDSLGIEQGDIILIKSGNARGEITNVEILLDYDKDIVPRKMSPVGEYPYLEADFSSGYVLRKDGNVVEWCHGNQLTLLQERHNIPSNAQICVFDDSLKENKVYQGTTADILDAKSVGAANASAIIMYGEQGNLRRVILHKRGWKKAGN